jgi:general secretion pathway protein C
MFVRVCAFVIWALVAATLVFWGLRVFVHAQDAPAHAVPVGASVAARGDLTRLLGSAPVATAAVTLSPEASSRFKLLGVMAPKTSARAEPSGQGVALIAVDGKPAKAFAVGARLDDDLVLQSVGLRTASIGPAQGATSVKLEIPPLPAPATGSLPSGFNVGSAGTPPPIAPTAMPQAPPPVMAAGPVPAIAPAQPQISVPPPQMVPGSAPVPPPNPTPSKRDFGAASR